MRIIQRCHHLVILTTLYEDEPTSSLSSTYEAVTSTQINRSKARRKGDQLYVDDSNDNQVYILKDGDTSNTPILIKDGEYAAFGLYEDYSMMIDINKKGICC